MTIEYYNLIATIGAFIVFVPVNIGISVTLVKEWRSFWYWFCLALIVELIVWAAAIDGNPPYLVVGGKVLAAIDLCVLLVSLYVSVFKVKPGPKTKKVLTSIGEAFIKLALFFDRWT